MLDGLDATMELAGPDTKLVPRHGTIIKRGDIVPYRDMILLLRGLASKLFFTLTAVGSRFAL
jgi:hypothetical protein